MLYDCNACGACCAWSPDWPRLSEAERAASERGGEGPPQEWVEDGHIRWAGDRCSALSGEIGCDTRCRIYARRPEVCRACQPGDPACHVARLHHGLPIEAPDSSMEALLDGGGGRVRLRR